MKFVPFLLFVIESAQLPVLVGPPIYRDKNFIRRTVGFGIPVNEGEIPYQVYLEAEHCACKKCEGPFLCGGTLVKDTNENQWVVTAAHCVDRLGQFHLGTWQIKNFQVKAGSVYLTNRDKLQVRDIPFDDKIFTFHPDWKGFNDDSSCDSSNDCKNFNSTICLYKDCSECTENPKYSGK